MPEAAEPLARITLFTDGGSVLAGYVRLLTEEVSMNRILAPIFAALFAPALLSAAPNPPDIVVMTQNQYLGADLTPIITAETGAEYAAAILVAIESIANNNIPERAEALAASIVERDAHLVGLQEVFAFNCTSNPYFPWPYPGEPCDLFSAAMNDHLQLTEAALADQGAEYVAKAVVYNLVLPTPEMVALQIPGLPVFLDESGVPAAFIGVIDRDVILARRDIADDTSPVPFPAVCSKPSGDGCNYFYIAEAEIDLDGEGGNPPLTIPVERGFVGVDTEVDGEFYRFVNTHLELRYPSPVEDARIIQALQAAELIETALAVHPPERELLIVGDINSSPEDEPVETSFGAAYPPYLQLSEYFADTWDLRPGKPLGHTCCEEADLSNSDSQLYERIDVIFSLNVPSRVKANLLNNDPVDKTASGLWPSDHATVVARLWY